MSAPDLYCRREVLHSVISGKRAIYTKEVKAVLVRGPRVALVMEISVIRYSGAMSIARVVLFYGVRIKPSTELQPAEKCITADVERRGGHPSKGG